MGISKAVNAEDHTTTICVKEGPAYSRCKIEYAQRGRERGTKYIFIKNATVTKNSQQQPTFTKGYKVTLYSD